MIKIKEFFQTDIKDILKKYLLTNITIWIITIICLFEGLRQNTDILTILSFCAIQFWAIETIFKDKTKKIIGYIVSIIVSIGINAFIQNTSKMNDILVQYIGSIISVYISSISLIGIYTIIKKADIKFHEYVIKIFENLLKTGIVYGILQIGIIGLIYIFMSLILNNTTGVWEVIGKAEILLSGFYLTPATIYSFTKTENETSKALKNILSYVILPLVVAALVIVYMYIVRILVNREIPKNFLFGLNTGIFIASYFVWTTCYSLREEKRTVGKIATYMPIIFIPLLILQIYSLAVRIIPYGITIQRYMGIVILVFEICAIVFSLIKQRKHESKIIFATIGIMIFVLLVPFVNVFDAPANSQLARLKKVWKEGQHFEDLSDEDKKTAESILDYFRYDSLAKNKVPSYIDETEITKYNDKQNNIYDYDLYNDKSYNDTVLNGTTREYEKIESISYYKNAIETEKGIELPEGFKTIKWGQVYPKGSTNVNQGMEYSKNGHSKEALENATTTYADTTVNLYNYINELLEIKKKSSSQAEIDKYVESNIILNTNNPNIVLYITNITISYTESEAYKNGEAQMPKISYVNFEGYFLYK